MHLGHRNGSADAATPEVEVATDMPLPPSLGLVLLVLSGLLLKLAIAALTTWTYGGLMPHAKQGGIGVFSLEVAGSKFEGTRFEKEHIGQIQVALVGIRCAGVLLVVDPSGLPTRPADEGCPRSMLAVLCAMEKCLAAFGYMVIFGDDFMKPACFHISSY